MSNDDATDWVDFMLTKFSWKTLAVTIGTILFASASFAQTPQTSGNSTMSSNAAPQAQADPVGTTHSDGQSGKSSRPYERDVTMPSNLDKPPQ
jgi:hypothetical protein